MLSKREAEREVRENILPFWMGMADMEHGGYYGEADFYGTAVKDAHKGGILHARILWTFSAAYRLFNDETYKEHAARARRFLADAFYDAEYGGLYWLVDRHGKPLDTRKQFYNIAFGIYALSEHYRATSDEGSLELAIDLFNTTEMYGLDTAYGGYIEARTCEWNSVSDSRLSGKDLNVSKSMNTNLHVMEAYTNLLRACEQRSHSETERVRTALSTLVGVTKEHIITPAGHFTLFFDKAWRSQSGDISYGHDIEGSWLLYDAALALNNATGISDARETALRIAEAALAVAIDHEHGGLFGGCDETGRIYSKKEWWPQAEAVVGFYNAYELSGDTCYLDAANGIWEFIQNHYADRDNGEWHNELSLDNVPDSTMPKAGFWKCLYHNARACFEMIRRYNTVSHSMNI